MLRQLAKRVLLATSNPGKLRDFAASAKLQDIELVSIPGFSSLPRAVEDGSTFEENARNKVEFYSHFAPSELVLADDSGLEVDALNGAPGIHSARYAADELDRAEYNSADDRNNERLLRELDGLPLPQRTGRFLCVIAAARHGQTLGTFRGAAEGIILDRLQGSGGFGYDPLFYFPPLRKTFAELTLEEKARYSHRGAAFRSFLSWYSAQQM